MCGVIFLRRWKRELDFVAANAGVFGISAFLAAMGGVLLWVSGGSGWYFVKTAGHAAPSVAALFALSLTVCGCCGLSAAMILMWGRAACPMRSVWPSACAVAGAYLAHLGWYAAAMCTRMTVFGGILAVVSVLLTAAARVLLRKPPAILTAALLALLAGESYFVYATFSRIL